MPVQRVQVRPQLQQRAVVRLPSLIPQEWTCALQRLRPYPAHNARGVKVHDNGRSGVVVEGGVSVDLTDAVIENNRLNGIRVDACAGRESAAPITLDGAVIQGNGRNGKKDANDNSSCSLLVEQPSSKPGWTNRVHVGTAAASCECPVHKGQAMCIMPV